MSRYLRHAGMHRAPRKRVISVAAVAALATGAVVAGAVISGAPGRALAGTTATDIYVDRSPSANCSDSSSASGTDATPFCTIGAAAAAAQPGQTVIIEPGLYAPVTISTSGTPGSPITFDGATEGVATIEATGKTSAFYISGAHDVVIHGFTTYAEYVPAYEVTGSSSGITIDGGRSITQLAAAVEVDAASDVTISRGSYGAGTGVQVDQGASGVVVTGNTFIANRENPAVAITGAPGTDVTGNTLVAQCGPVIAVSGASAGGSIENNIVWGTATSSSFCTSPDAATAISVAAGSTSGATADYNLINPSGISALYDWGGTRYATVAAFTAATGQGTHDLAADPKLGTQRYTSTLGRGTSIWYLPQAGSPAIDSANANAPGELLSDELGNPRADDPGVANTGTGSGSGTSTSYFDRGATEVEGGFTFGGETLVPGGPLTATAASPMPSSWTTNGPTGNFAYDFGDSKYPIITTASSLRHTFATSGPKSVSIDEAVGGGLTGGGGADTVIGAGYTPVTPTRVLDTRNGTGTVKASAVAANGTVTLSLPGIDGTPAADIAAVVMNVTVTQPGKGGYLVVYPGSGTPPASSSINFAAGQTIPNLVTVTLSGGKVSFHNSSGGTVQVIADLAGFYGPGNGFQPRSPSRVLDTRNGKGAAKQALAAGSRLQLNLSGKVPAGTTAVVLNVTVTGPQKGGYLSVYPDSATVPGTSSLNFTPGETIANLVIVPLANGVADFYNGSPGTVQVIADLGGYYAASAQDSFIAEGPTRVQDTRSTHAVGASGTDVIYSLGIGGPCNICATVAAAVDNITVTQPAKAGHLTAYPYGQPRPGTSTLNFSAGETIANQAMVQTGGPYSDFVVYNGSSGTVQLVVDQYGCFIAPVTLP